MQISPHFKLREMEKSTTAARFGIDNSASPEQIEAGKILAENILEPVRNTFGIPFSPGSWLRTEELEKAICWGDRDDSSFGRWCMRRDKFIDDESWSEYFARKSHPRGEAADIELSGVSNYHLAKWINKNCQFDQLILEFYKQGDPNSGWVHVSFKSIQLNRQQVLTIGHGNRSEGLVL